VISAASFISPRRIRSADWAKIGVNYPVTIGDNLGVAPMATAAAIPQVRQIISRGRAQ